MDYAVPTIMMPSIVIGVSLGALANRVVPDVLGVFGIAIALAAITGVTVKKYIDTRKYELGTLGPTRWCWCFKRY